MGIIIPYQELLGNYDAEEIDDVIEFIIPYQELLGNYDTSAVQLLRIAIIPYQELLGNYDSTHRVHLTAIHYTIPRAIREL